MKRLLFVFLIFSFLNVDASESKKLSLYWRNKNDRFHISVDQDIAEKCTLITLAKMGCEQTYKEIASAFLNKKSDKNSKPLNYFSHVLVDVQSSENTVWDKDTIEKSFNFLKNPVVIANTLSLDQLEEVEQCIDYLHPDDDYMNGVQKIILEDISKSTLGFKQKYCLIEWALRVGSKIQTIFDGKNCRHNKNGYRMDEKDVVLNLDNLKRDDKIEYQLWFSGNFHSVLTQRMPKIKKIKCYFSSNNIIYFDGSGLKGNEESKFIFSKDLSEELKDYITQEIKSSNNRFSGRFYRTFLNYNPANIFFYTGKKTSKFIDKNAGYVFGSIFLTTAIFGVLIWQLGTKEYCEIETNRILLQFNACINAIKDELLSKEVLLSGLEATIAEPIRNEFKKYIFTPGWEKLFSLLQKADFKIPDIELLKAQHFDRLVPINLAINNIILKENKWDLLLQDGLMGLASGLLLTGLSVGCLKIFTLLGDKFYRYFKKNKVKFE